MSATNSLGWEIQEYSHEPGWQAITAPFATPELARSAMGRLAPSAAPRRVYEALDHKAA